MKQSSITMLSKAITVVLLSMSQSLTGGIYAEITRENSKSLVPNSVPRPKDIKYYSQYLEWNMEKQKNISSFDKRNIVFTIFQQHEEKYGATTHDVIDKTSWQDLNILCGPKSDVSVYLADKVDRTNTELGKVALMRMLIDPLVDLSEIRGRQTIVKELYENPALSADLEEAFKKLRVSENLLFSFWQDDVFSQAFQRKLIRLPGLSSLEDMLNTEPITVEIRERLQELSDVLMAVSNTAGTVIPPAIAVMLLAKFIPQADAARQFARNRMYVSPAVGLFTMAGLSTWLLNQFLPVNRFSQAANDVATGYSYGTGLPFSTDNVKANVIILACMQEKLIAVSNFLKTLKEFEKVIESHDDIKKHLPDAEALHHVLHVLPQKSTKFKKLLAILDTATFKGEPSVLSWVGRILSAYKLVIDQKDELASAMIALGYMDAHLSIMKLYKEQEGKQHRWCFAEFKDGIDAHCLDDSVCTSSVAGTPSLALENFWNPFLSPDSAVPNSLAFGEDSNPRTLIITGPNAGGKSTTMKGVVLSLILAQSLGIAPAQSMRFTPVSKIMTYLTITDDMAAGNSHFEAGVLRAQELVEMTKVLKNGEFAFIAVDELFNGTTFREGQAAAYSLIEFLGKQPGVLCSTATHFPLLTRMEEKSDGKLFKNYKVSVTYTDDGHIVYPYKLEQGISLQCVALDVLREKGFAHGFLERANEILTEFA